MAGYINLALIVLPMLLCRPAQTEGVWRGKNRGCTDMFNQYLIDYENIHESGLYGIKH